MRYFSPNEELIPTPEEANLQERQQKELALQQQKYERQQKELALQQQEYERQQKELALQRIVELTAKLRELGINPDENL